MVKTAVSLCAVLCSLWLLIFDPSLRWAKTLATSNPSLDTATSFICASKTSSETSPLRYALTSCCTSKSRVAILRSLLFFVGCPSNVEASYPPGYQLLSSLASCVSSELYVKKSAGVEQRQEKV